MFKRKNIKYILIIIFLALSTTSVLAPKVANAAAAKCYFSDGSLIVENPCGTAGGGSSASRTYKDISGNTISGPQADKCYVTTSTGSHVVYTEAGNCAELASSAATDQQRCEASGGTWQNSKCESCPSGSISNGVSCVEGSGFSTLDGDCKEASLSKENCGIIGYLVLFINVLSALVGIVAVIMIVFWGIQYSASRDNPQMVSQAKIRILWTVIAVAVYLFFYIFLQWLVPGGVF